MLGEFWPGPATPKLDVETMKALGRGDNARRDEVEAQKQALRDLPQTFDLSGARTTQELKGRALKHKAGSDQHSEFVKAAREIGTDESEDAFDKVLRKVASAPPPKSVQKRKKKAKRK
jgi:hypothetical protein